MVIVDAPGPSRPSRIQPADRVIMAHGLSSFCTGLAFPYTAIHLASKLGTGSVALFFSSTAVASLVVAVTLAAGYLRLSRLSLCLLGNALWFIGYLAMPFVGSSTAVLVVGTAIGSGQGCFFAAIVPIVNSLVSPQQRRAVFARRYAVLNATLAAGSLLAGVLTILLPRSVIPYFFVANAFGMIPVALAVVLSRRHLPHERASDDDPGAGLSVVALCKVALPAVLFQFAVFALGFSQLEAVVPLVSEKLMGMGLFTVSLLLVCNVAVIVVAQRWVTRLLADLPELTGLRIAIGLWVIGYLIAGVLAFGPFEIRLAGLLAYAALFALGECAYSCSFHPWLISMVPDSELTRANALSNSTMGIGQFAGPGVGVGLALSGSAPLVWFGLALCCTTVTLLAGVLSAAIKSGRNTPCPTS
jgi:MFS family permease